MRLTSITVTLVAAWFFGAAPANADFGPLVNQVPKASVGSDYLAHIASNCNKVKSGEGVCATQAQADKANRLRPKAVDNCDTGYPPEYDNGVGKAMCEGVIGRTPRHYIAEGGDPCASNPCKAGEKCTNQGGKAVCESTNCPGGCGKDGICKNGKCACRYGGTYPDGCKPRPTTPPGTDKCKYRKCKDGVCDPESGKCVDLCEPNPCGENNVCLTELVEDKPTAVCYCQGELAKFGAECKDECPVCPAPKVCDPPTPNVCEVNNSLVCSPNPPCKPHGWKKSCDGTCPKTIKEVWDCSWKLILLLIFICLLLFGGPTGWGLLYFRKKAMADAAKLKKEQRLFALYQQNHPAEPPQT